MGNITIRDPLHGTISFEKKELGILDHPVVQRLRMIKQLGFAEDPYPGASHSRFLHSIGAMFVASKMWDSICRSLSIPVKDQRRFRQIVRMAVLLHDVGHAPMSHAVEFLMPLRKDFPYTLASSEGQANHEDYTLLFILHTDLSESLQKMDCPPEAVASLISGKKMPSCEDFFVCKDLDFYPILRQLVSSELDADRMDYLRRDSFFTGVAYGNFDLDWIIRSLRPIQQEKEVYLGLSNRAIFAYEDFLLSRYNMFFLVYFHHRSVCYEAMLQKAQEGNTFDYVFPTDPEEYRKMDDALWFSFLHSVSDPWVQRVAQKQPFQRVLELMQIPRFETPSVDFNIPAFCDALDKAGIPFLKTDSDWILSGYKNKKKKRPSLFVVEEPFNRITPIEEYSVLYQRYAGNHRITRVFCDASQCKEAQKILEKYSEVQQSVQLSLLDRNTENE